MTTPRFLKLAVVAAPVLSLAVCGGSNTSSATLPTAPTAATTTTTTPVGPGTTPASLPAIYGRFGNGVQVSLDGQTVVIRTTDVPDHPSPYWGLGNPSYEAPQDRKSVV